MAAIRWASGISGNWTQAANWSTGTVPGSTDNVTIDAAGSYTVIVDQPNSALANSLVFNAPAATIDIVTNRILIIVNGATITGGTIDGPGTIRTEGISQITSGAPVTVGGGLNWTINSGDTLNLGAPIVVGDGAGSTAAFINNGFST
jgi:hypothetical protein